MIFKALAFISTVAACSAILQGTIDVNRLQGILQEGLGSKDLSSIYYSVKGLKEINAKIPDICQVIKSANYDLNNIEQIFYLTNAASLSGCQNFLKPDVLTAPARTLDKKDVSLIEMYHAVYSLKAIGKGQTFEKEEALKNLIQLLKKDDTPANYGYVFALCEHMGCEAWTAQHSEGVLLSADESDSKSLHFEGGLPVTSFLLTTILRSYKSLKKPAPLTLDQRYKFATYLVSRRSVNTPRGAALLLEAAVAVADDQPTPISVAFKDRKYITSELDTIEFSVTDIIGRAISSLKPEEVVAQSGTRLADDVVVLSKQPLTQKQNDQTTYILNLNKIKTQYGMYKISLAAGTKSANFNVAVLGEIQLGNLELGIGDVDGTTSPKVTTLAFPNKLTDVLQADHLQKVSLKFSVKDKWGKPVLVQQAFVRVAPSSGDDEAIFVAEPDNTKAYKVDLNVAAVGKLVQQKSGRHSLSVYLGDSAVSNPLLWDLGEIAFNFGKDAVAIGEDKSRANSVNRGPLPEISHKFREPDARPPRLVSDVFAAACAAPLLILLLLWARIGINFGNLPFTPAALVFHLALGGSLALYGLFWLQLSMFATLRYLAPLAVVTFLSGHSLLRRLAQDKQDKKR
ncbi:dolichyl-diphosphooligosaccharide--protein glycosyltransferase subunit 2 isoform X2 [Pieris brassicae]|uniref:dolichyl-diphosphooligosaccharide--protein glycosyltransferase subunit 2 isoform X2 n=1 Tax=Pieris brassicae TaxID=7116 RepID=UPI001E662431|nr:dolichyl-diphosphooligosaccharide--protein glycosyltransferase subunit 2 isoform X2 [Pieris brassicae]